MIQHEGWCVLTLVDDRVVAGLLRLEIIGSTDQWALDVPPNGIHHGYTAILSPSSILKVEPCTEDHARSFCTPAAAPPAALHNEPTAAQASA